MKNCLLGKRDCTIMGPIGTGCHQVFKIMYTYYALFCKGNKKFNLSTSLIRFFNKWLVVVAKNVKMDFRYCALKKLMCH